MKEILSAAIVGAGHTYKLRSATDLQAIQIEFTGTITALEVAINGSISSTKLFPVESHLFTESEITAKAAFFYISQKLVEYVQAEIISITGTGVVHVYHSPADSQSDMV
jgi:hypothetical protein